MDVASALMRITSDVRDIAQLLSGWLRHEVELESERLVLWIPVGLGMGVGLYFLLPSEPSAFTGLVLPLIAAILVIRHWITHDGRPSRLRIVGMFAVLLICVGYASAYFRTQQVLQPLLEDDAVGWVTARIVETEPRVKDRRLTLDLLSHELNDDIPPGLKRIRVTYRVASPQLTAGDIIRLRVWLKPLPLPTYPGGFDFGRHIFYLGIAATGFSISDAVVIEAGQHQSWLTFISELRQQVYARIRGHLPEENGAVAAALISGQKGSLSPETRVALQQSGLAHILAISGLHIGIVAAGVFGLVQLLAALWPWLALRILPAHIGALCAIPATFFYLFLAGSTTPTIRATIMTVIALVALLFSRHPFSLRMVMVAACLILLVWPESMLTASFQMSFAAVTALIALLENPGFGRDPSHWRQFPYWPLRYLGLILLTTAIASAATTFFVAWHFQRVPTYGVLANLLAVPLTALWIMPLGFLSLVSMPFDLERLPLDLMGWGINGLIAIAHQTAAMPQSSMAVPAPPFASFLLAIGGGLWFLIWKRRWHYGGLVAIALAVMIWPLRPVPDILVNGDGTLVALRSGDGAWAVSPWRKQGFTRGNWLQAMGQEQEHPWPDENGEAVERLSARCDPSGCSYRRQGKIIAIVRDAAALELDCRRADLVIILISYADCPDSRAQTLPYWRIRMNGGTAISVHEDHFALTDVVTARGDRAWTSTGD